MISPTSLGIVKQIPYKSTPILQQNATIIKNDHKSTEYLKILKKKREFIQYNLYLLMVSAILVKNTLVFGGLHADQSERQP
jgi:hypothetical protein